MAHLCWVLKHTMCMHYFRQVASTNIPILAYHMHGQTCMIMPVADFLGATRPSSVLHWVLSLSVGHLQVVWNTQ